MNVIARDHKKEKAKRDWKFKEERTELERSLTDLNKRAELISYFLAAIFMVLLGIFIRLVLMEIL